MKMRLILPCLVVGLAASASAQLRLATWNVTNYSSGRVDAFRTAIYGEFMGRRMAPDVLVGQEFISAAAVTNFLDILNGAVGSPGDWAAAPFIDGPDTDNALFYRTTKVTFLAQTIAAAGSTNTSDQPRHTIRYDVRPKGYSGAAATLAIYSCHMKAAGSTADQQRRQVEAARIVQNVAALPAGWIPVVVGDFNMQSSNQQAWTTLTNTTAGGGPFLDPIATPGSWDNNANFRFVHTQEPATQMDSRFDFILFGRALADGRGLDYRGQAGVGYSTSTWNDPNHSYRCWGNDGESFNVPLRTTANTMVGPVIAQALIASVNNNGHLPVLVDLNVPPKIGVRQTRLDFGKVRVGVDATLALDVANVADLKIWRTDGVTPLSYSFNFPPSIVSLTSPRALPPRRQPTRHLLRLRATEAGALSGTVTITSDDPDRPIVTLPWTANVRA